MDEKLFWDIIGTSRSLALQKGNGSLHPHDQMNELRNLLVQLSGPEIVAFQQRFREFFWQAYRWDIWTVVYWRYGGCGDDGFMDVRSCLIALGKDLFFQVLNDPDSLTDLFDRPDVPFLKYEGFDSVAYRVYEHKVGKWPKENITGLRDPTGERIDHNDQEEMRRRFPRLLARFPEMGD